MDNLENIKNEQLILEKDVLKKLVRLPKHVWIANLVNGKALLISAVYGVP